MALFNYQLVTVLCDSNRHGDAVYPDTLSAAYAPSERHRIIFAEFYFEKLAVDKKEAASLESVVFNGHIRKVQYKRSIQE